MSEFEDTLNESYRWRIADTLDVGNVSGVGEWIIEKLQDPSVGDSKSMLLLAAARHSKQADVVREARALFDVWPVHASDALRKVGTVDDLAFVHAKLAQMEAQLADMMMNLEVLRGRKKAGGIAVTGVMGELKERIAKCKDRILGVRREVRGFERRLAREAAKRAKQEGKSPK